MSLSVVINHAYIMAVIFRALPRQALCHEVVKYTRAVLSRYRPVLCAHFVHLECRLHSAHPICGLPPTTCGRYAPALRSKHHMSSKTLTPLYPPERYIRASCKTAT
jgi:hypothetical protein